jgi:hypothetical protein
MKCLPRGAFTRLRGITGNTFERSKAVERLERFERPAVLLMPFASRLLPISSGSNFVSSLDFLHVTTLDYLFEDALIQKILDLVFRYLGITQSDDFLYSS